MKTDDADNNGSDESQESYYKRANLSDMTLTKAKEISIKSLVDSYLTK